MRIGIREQLGLLVLLTTLIALAVVAIATVCPHTQLLSSLGLLLMERPIVGQQLQLRRQHKVRIISLGLTIPSLNYLKIIKPDPYGLTLCRAAVHKSPHSPVERASCFDSCVDSERIAALQSRQQYRC